MGTPSRLKAPRTAKQKASRASAGTPSSIGQDDATCRPALRAEPLDQNRVSSAAAGEEDLLRAKPPSRIGDPPGDGLHGRADDVLGRKAPARLVKKPLNPGVGEVLAAQGPRLRPAFEGRVAAETLGDEAIRPPARRKAAIIVARTVGKERAHGAIDEDVARRDVFGLDRLGTAASREESDVGDSAQVHDEPAPLRVAKEHPVGQGRDRSPLAARDEVRLEPSRTSTRPGKTRTVTY